MKTLAVIVVPLFCAAAAAPPDVDALITAARGAPGEFAADSLIRIAVLDSLDRDRRIELLEQSFERASGAQQPYKRIQCVALYVGGHPPNTLDQVIAENHTARVAHQQFENGGGNDSTDHGGGDAFHNVGAGLGRGRPHDGQQAEKNGANGHDFRPDPLDGAFDGGSWEPSVCSFELM